MNKQKKKKQRVGEIKQTNKAEHYNWPKKKANIKINIENWPQKKINEKNKKNIIEITPLKK